MSEPNVPKPPVVERLTESVWAKFLARLVVPAGIAAMLYIGDQTLKAVDNLSDLMTLVRLDVREQKARVDAHERQLNTHELRLNWLGRRSFGSRDPPEAPAP